MASALIRNNLARIIRDYVYDVTMMKVIPPPDGVTVKEVVQALQAIQGTTHSDGAVRRPLNDLVSQGYLILDSTSRPAKYSWNKPVPKPNDYVNGTANVAGNTAVPASGLSDNDKRVNLRGKIQGRMFDITGDNNLGASSEQETIKPKKAPKKGILRLNGEVYQPRDLAGKVDVEALQQLRAKKIFALLSGPPGTGKTVLADAAFAAGEGGIHVITGNENTNVEAFMGQWSPTGDPAVPYHWVDGPLVNAMRTGGVLFIDDATLINPKVNAVVYPAMDGRNEVIVTDHLIKHEDGSYGPDVVKAKEGFYVIAAHNPGVHGAILTDALASRFVAQIWVETDLELAASLGVTDKFIKLVKALRVDRDKGQPNIWVPQLRELLAARDMAKVFDENVAAANLLGQTPEDDRAWMADKMRVIFNHNVTPLEVGPQL